MATRDRDTPPADDDAAVVDRLLQKLRASGPTPGLPAPPPTPAVVHAAHRSRFEARAGAATSLPSSRHRVPAGPAGTWTRVALGVVLAAALTQWPYERACGVGLAAYLVAVATLLATALWGAVATWKIRLAAAHVAALCILLLGLALAAQEILPRAGYLTMPSAAWRCVTGR